MDVQKILNNLNAQLSGPNQVMSVEFEDDYGNVTTLFESEVAEENKTPLHKSDEYYTEYEKDISRSIDTDKIDVEQTISFIDEIIDELEENPSLEFSIGGTVLSSDQMEFVNLVLLLARKACSDSYEYKGDW